MVIMLEDPTCLASFIEAAARLGYRDLQTFPTSTPAVAVVDPQGPEDAKALAAMPGVWQVLSTADPYPLAGRGIWPEDRRVRIADVEVGGPEFIVMAGPCSVEHGGSLDRVAESVQRAGARVLRGGAFKPRTSPYAFQGLGREGLALLDGARQATGLPIVTEVMEPAEVEAVAEAADCLQIGARNMQNFPLLREVGAAHKPVLLKRGFGCTVDELLWAAEYVLSAGCDDVILCERGIRTFERETRFTFDLAAVAALKTKSRLPVIADPSHAAGHPHLVPALALGALAAGADGLILEVHDAPQTALSDGDQALSLGAFSALMDRLVPVAAAVGRHLGEVR